VSGGEVLRGVDWSVRSITQEEAQNAIERWHYAQGCPNTSVERHGLFRRDEWFGGELRGVAMWLPPTRNAAATVAGEEWRNVLALTRFVLDPAVPHNGASFLLGSSMRLLDRQRWPWLLTYADSSQGHIGSIYRSTNWTYLGPWKAGDTWVGPDGEQRGRKRGGRNLSADEMRSNGFERRPPAVKHKYVHHVGRVGSLPAAELAEAAS
jgi:hypothetical protein